MWAAKMPLACAPEKACLFDWGHKVVLISGVPVSEKVAYVRLCRSRMMFVRR